MSDRNNVTRRNLLRASAVSAAGLSGIGTVSALEPTDGTTDTESLRESAEPIPCLKVDNQMAVIEPGERAVNIRPGSQMFIDFGDSTAGCTANFIWRPVGVEDESKLPDAVDIELPERAEGEPGNQDDGGGDLFIGAAGHCFLDEDADADEDAAREFENADDVSDLTVSVCAECNVGGLTGLSVVDGESIELGEVVYARQTTPEEEGGSGVGHDFGLVRIPEENRDLVDPTLPQWGGPNGSTGTAVPEGEPVHQYGAGVANGEVFPTMGSTGASLGGLGTPEDWFAAIRATPGDSGSPLIDAVEGTGNSNGAGVLTHLTTTGVAGTTMDRCIEMVEEDIGLEIELVEAGDL